MTDKRVRVMNEIISGMRLIKMYAWEWAFHSYIKEIRKYAQYLFKLYTIYYYCRKESKIIVQAGIIQGINYTLLYTSLGILSFTIFSTYAGLGNTLTPKKVFTAITLFSILRLFCVRFIILFLRAASELIVAYKRIEVRQPYV